MPILLLCAAPSLARADTFESRETFGIDLATVWEPRNGDALGAGPVLRAETNTTKMPAWLDFALRWGMLLDSADRVYMPIMVGLAANLGPSYVGLDLGTLLHPDEMTDKLRVSSTINAAVGVRIGHWNVRATAMRGELFDGTAWMFSLGRDFVRTESTVKRSFF